MSESALIAAARSGDGTAFAALLTPYRAELVAHCRRILRCQHDAEDAYQEVMLRAWRALDRFQGRSSLRSWLYTIATNTCLNEVSRRERRPRVSDEELVDEGYVADQHESVEEALAAAHEHLPSGQRAALLLRDGFGFTARESATLLGTTTVSVNSALQRARVSMASSRPPHRVNPRAAQTVRLMREAVEHDDIDRFVDMLRAADGDVGERHWTYA